MMRLVMAILAAAVTLAAQPKLTPLSEATLPKLIAGHKGKILLVDFWATWCVPCRAEMPQLVKLSAKLGASGLDFVTVSADEPGKEAAAIKLLMENAVGGPFFLKKPADDDKFNDLVDAKWSGELPAMFIYDRTGKRIRSFLGETPVSDIEAAIQKLLK
jgi:thiol-disulfide isomerase/thioredoxin